MKKKKEEVIEIKGKAWVIIGLLIIVIVLQLLAKYPIQVNIDKTITDCPEIVCRDVVCSTTVEIINKTVIERESFFGDWDSITWINTS